MSAKNKSRITTRKWIITKESFMIKLNQFERDIELFVNEDDDDEEDDDEELKISKKMVGIFMKARNVM